MSTSLRTTGGDLALPRVVVKDFNSVVLQSAIDALALWSQEWFLDQNVGTKWASVLGVKIVSTRQIEQMLQRVLLAVQGIISVTASSVFDRAKRNFAYTFTAGLNNGAILTGGSGTPFTVTGGP